jgi:choline dehydrogenase-like flavoprotein
MSKSHHYGQEPCLVDVQDQVPDDPGDHVWDVVVIGTGVGGATAGLNLARLGRRVLFLERGHLSRQTNSATWLECRGNVLAARSAKPQECLSVVETATIPVACELGGSTTVFGMMMERLRAVDFTPYRFSSGVSSTSLPNEWPIKYEELEPYYRKAEELFRVRGTEDPLAPSGVPLLEPPPPSIVERHIRDTLLQCGLHPYRLHYACESAEGCDGCYQRKCPHACRNDARRVCLSPALATHGAHILPDCQAVKLTAVGRAVREVLCVKNGSQIAIRGRIFVLALSASLTPILLLRSTSNLFPNGLGNNSDMVGRNLMLHVSDTILVKFRDQRGCLNEVARHGQCLNDFYVCNGTKLGNLHMHAATLAIGESEQVLSNDGGTAAFHTIVEDFPYLENRLMLGGNSGDEGFWQYRYPQELRARSEMLVRAFTSAVGQKCEVQCLREPGVLNLNRGHACGTCRFGDEPKSSVLDRNNRIHDVDNVYVVDGSFFPSSGGVGPSLTIAANSLRVSDVIARQH